MAMRISEVIPVKLILHLFQLDKNTAAVLFFFFSQSSVYAQFTVHATQIQSTVTRPVGLVFRHFYLEMTKYQVNICTSMQANQISLSSGRVFALLQV